MVALFSAQAGVFIALGRSGVQHWVGIGDAVLATAYLVGAIRFVRGSRSR